MISRTMRYVSLLLFVATALVGTASAQSGEQVLRLWVGYNTLRNSAQMDAAKKAEVDALGKKAQSENAAKDYGAAMNDLYHALALMRGEQWTADRAVSLALNVEPDHALLEPDQSVVVELSERYKPDLAPDGPIAGSLKLVDQMGSSVATLGTLAKVDADLKAHPTSLTVVVPNIGNGNYRLKFVMKPARGEPITKDVSVHIERGLLGRALALKGRVDALYPKLNAGHKQELIDALQTVLYHVDLCMLADKHEIDPSRVDFDKELREGENELASIESGSDPFAARRGDFRRAYLSKVDGSRQPYRIYIPTSYDGSKAFPLIVALHGMGGDENTWFDLYDNGLFKTLAEKHGYIVVCPKGRGPASMYRGPAEQDVLDVLAEARRNYKIDPDRIYLTGHSMGGFGTWSIAIDHPEIFAALAPISGGGDPKGMVKIAAIPEIVTHGDNDKTVPVERSREMVAAGRKAGAEIKYDEIHGGSHISVAVPAFPQIFDFFDSHRKSKGSKYRLSAGKG